MKKIHSIFCVILTIFIIVISGCAEQYDVPAPPPKKTPAPEPEPTATQIISTPFDPAEILEEPSWTNKIGFNVKDVSISDDGNYIGGLSLHKAIVKTPTKNILTNIYWKNGNNIVISDSGNYIAVADENFVRLYDNDGVRLLSYDAYGMVHQIAVLDNGNIIQSSEKKPHLSIADKNGADLWEWNMGISTAKDLEFDYSDNIQNIFIGTYEGKIYYVSNVGKNLWFKDLDAVILDVEMSENSERMYVLTDDNIVYSFDKYGNKNWEKELNADTIGIEITGNGDYILTQPLDRPYEPSYQNKVFLFDKDGNVEWQKTFSHVGVIGISEDSKYIVISEDRYLKMYDLEGNVLADYFLESAYGNFFVSLDMTPDAHKLVLGTTRSVMVFG